MPPLELVSPPGGGNWWMSPYFFVKKIWPLILVIASESDDIFSCHLLTFSPPLPSSLSSVLSRFSHKNNFRVGCHHPPGGCHRGGRAPCAPPVTPLLQCTVLPCFFFPVREAGHVTDTSRFTEHTQCDISPTAVYSSLSLPRRDVGGWRGTNDAMC